MFRQFYNSIAVDCFRDHGYIYVYASYISICIYSVYIMYVCFLFLFVCMHVVIISSSTLRRVHFLL